MFRRFRYPVYLSALPPSEAADTCVMCVMVPAWLPGSGRVLAPCRERITCLLLCGRRRPPVMRVFTNQRLGGRESEYCQPNLWTFFSVFMAFNSFCWILASHYLALLSFARSLELVQTQQKVFALSAGLDYH